MDVCFSEQGRDALEEVVGLLLAGKETLVEQLSLLDHLVVLADNIVVLNDKPREKADMALDFNWVIWVGKLLLH